jgi:hypothetical protein
VTFAGAGWADKNRTIGLGDELQRMQFKAGALGDLGVVAPVELGQGSSLIKPRELVASFKEPRLSSIQLILE